MSSLASIHCTQPPDRESKVEASRLYLTPIEDNHLHVIRDFVNLSNTINSHTVKSE